MYNIFNLSIFIMPDKGTEKMTKEDKLKAILTRMEELKEDFAEVTDEYDADYADDQTMNLLTEAAGAIDDAIDCIYDAMEMAE